VIGSPVEPETRPDLPLARLSQDRLLKADAHATHRWEERHDAVSEKRDKDAIAVPLGTCKTAFLGVAVMSELVNILYLTGSFFMLEVYDRVIPSRSVPTLIGVAALALALYAFQGGP
jgi:ABC-type bacteriocin/lantibiotic exporter with double-glycine peptidase domain